MMDKQFCSVRFKYAEDFCSFAIKKSFGVIVPPKHWTIWIYCTAEACNELHASAELWIGLCFTSKIIPVGEIVTIEGIEKRRNLPSGVA